MSITSAAKSTPAQGRPPGGAKGSKGKSSKAKATRASAKSISTSTRAANKNGSKRLAPGGLNSLVLGYMKKNPNTLPATAGTVARGIKRSSGAVANCLGRLEKAGSVRVTSKKPRKFDLVTNPNKRRAIHIG
jgi:hypothetical protein